MVRTQTASRSTANSYKYSSPRFMVHFHSTQHRMWTSRWIKVPNKGVCLLMSLWCCDVPCMIMRRVDGCRVERLMYPPIWLRQWRECGSVGPIGIVSWTVCSAGHDCVSVVPTRIYLSWLLLQLHPLPDDLLNDVVNTHLTPQTLDVFVIRIDFQ